MADIYALQGTKYTGKTETIILVYHLLLEKYKPSPMQILDFRPIQSGLKVVLFGINDKKIGIESRGDSSWY